jgi:acyl transferase domain-containing protein
VSAFLEIGPGHALTAAAEDCLTGSDDPAASFALCAATGGGGAREPEALLSALARLHVHGARVDWPAVFEGTGARRVDLPTYAFQRRRYWLDAPHTPHRAVDPHHHPLLDPAFAVPDTDRTVFSGRLSLATHPWLADHVIAGAVLVPATAFVEMAVRAGDEVGGGTLDELVILTPLALPAAGSVRVQVVVGGADDSGRRPVDVHARPDESATDGPEPAWTRHATGLIGPTPTEEPAPVTDPAVWPPPGAAEVDLADAYDSLADGGLAYGPAFRGVRVAWRHGDELFAEVRLPEGESADAERHPSGAAGRGTARPAARPSRNRGRPHPAAVRVERRTPVRDGRVGGTGTSLLGRGGRVLGDARRPDGAAGGTGALPDHSGTAAYRGGRHAGTRSAGSRMDRR